MSQFITINGNVGQPPEYNSDKGYLKFSIACNDRRDREKTTWYSCTMFGKRGQAMADIITKGMKGLTVIGSYDFNQVGDKCYHNVIVSELILPPRDSGGGSNPHSAPQSSQSTNQGQGNGWGGNAPQNGGQNAWGGNQGNGGGWGNSGGSSW